MPQVKVGWRSGSVSPVVSVSKLLDTYSGAAAAYSLRKLSSTYTGSAIRVRRSSDNTEQNIGFDSDGNLDTVALSAFVGSGSGFVTTWYDQSGNSRNVAQTTAINQPQIVSTGSLILENGKVSVNFDGTNHRMYSSTLTNWTSSGFSTYIVSKSGGLNSNGRGIFAISDGSIGTNGYLHLLYRNNITNNFRAYYSINGGNTQSQTQNPINTFPTTQNLISVTRPASGNITFNLNNTQQSQITANTISGPISGNFILGNYYTQNSESIVYLHQGTISEVIVYPNSQQSNTNGIESNINTYYSVYPNPTSVWNLLAAAYNADSIGSSSLKTSLFAAYNGESNANDSFGSNNGTPQGGLTYTTGKIGNAFQFNGTNSFINLPTSSLQLTTFSINFWIFNPGNSAKTIAANMGNDGQNKGWYIDLTNGPTIRFVAFNNGVGVIGLNATGNSGYLNRWSMATITVNGTSVKMYLDGNLVNSGTMTNTINYTTTTYPLIGGYRVNNGSVSAILANNTRLDALNIWSKELTQSEITELYNSGNGAQYITDNFYKPTPNDALNTYNGTAQGGLTYGVGKVGTAFQFNGTNAYVSLPNSSGQFNFTGDFSVSMWFKSSNLSTSIYAIGNYKSGSTYGYGWILHYSKGNNGFTFSVRNGSVINEVGKSQVISTNTWYHVVAVRVVGQQHKLYVNGVDILANQADGNVNNIATYTANQPMNLGGLSDISLPVLCDLDGVNMWNRALTASEVSELYNSGNGKQYPF